MCGYTPGIADTVTLVDVAPTCLAAAGMTFDDSSIDGRDLFDAQGSGDHAVMVETVQDWHGLVCKSVVSGDWKLTWHVGEDFRELHYRADDPSARVIFWASADHQPRRAEMLSRLLDRHALIARSGNFRLSYA